MRRSKLPGDDTRRQPERNAYLPVSGRREFVEVAAVVVLHGSALATRYGYCADASGEAQRLGFVGLSPMGCAPVAFAVATAIGSNWRHQIVERGAHLAGFKIHAIVLFAIVVLVALGPLLVFVPRLAKLRRQGLLQYGALGQIHSMEFHKKWILNPHRNNEELLAAPEISSLTDFETSYENIEHMQPLLVDKGALILLALAVAMPMLPVVLAEIPLHVILKELLQAMK